MIHSWSLSVEEQFYLLWPACLKFLGRRNGAMVAVLAVVVAPLAKVASHHGVNHLEFISVSNSLATGCLLALFWERLVRLIDIGSAAASHTCLAVLGAAFLFYCGWSSLPQSANVARLFFVAGPTVTDVMVTLALILAVTRPPWILNCALVTFIGRISYSLYLWQQIWTLAWPYIGAWWRACALTSAILSYYLVEQPILRWRDRKIAGTTAESPGGAVVAARV